MKQILFVCTGNTCRSPMAEAILRHHGGELVAAKSAGVFAQPGSDASHHAKSALQEKGVDINHVSQQLNEELVRWADLVLTMTEGHKGVLLQSFPGAADKVFTFYEFVEDTKRDVADPYGGSLEVYQATLDELETLVQGFLKKLREEQ